MEEVDEWYPDCPDCQGTGAIKTGRGFRLECSTCAGGCLTGGDERDCPADKIARFLAPKQGE